VAFHRVLAGRFAVASGMALTLSAGSMSVTEGVAIALQVSVRTI
jgi:hypothetical protein